MASRRLTRSEWRRYCDQVSRELTGKSAELEVISLDLGDQIEVKWVPVLGIVYDPKSDVFEVALQGVDHLIAHPREVHVEETARGLVAIEIITDDDSRQIVRLREPLTLAAATPP